MSFVQLCHCETPVEKSVSCEKRGKIVSGVDKNLLKIAKKIKRAQKRGQLDGTSPSVWKDEEIKHKHKRGIAIYNLPNVYILAHFP